MSLTKQDIANTLVKKTELTQTQALALTNQFFDQIIETLKSGEEIKLSSFGNFTAFVPLSRSPFSSHRKAAPPTSQLAKVKPAACR